MVRYVLRCPAEREDDLVAELWELGTAGVEVVAAGEDAVRVEAYFEAPISAPPLAEAAPEPVPERDWLAAYRETARPFPVGERLLLDPREPGAGDDDPETEAARGAGRLRLRIPARAAFGTGSHESTRLVLELLEALDVGNRRVLDAGTGTGVLAFAALAFGAAEAVGYDLDPAAAFAARDNARRNGLHGRFLAGPVAALAGAAGPGGTGRFDLALVNMIPEHFLPDLPELARLISEGGYAVFSGILVEKRLAVGAALHRAGFVPFTERVEGEWCALVTRRAGAGLA